MHDYKRSKEVIALFCESALFCDRIRVRFRVCYYVCSSRIVVMPTSHIPGSDAGTLNDYYRSKQPGNLKATKTANISYTYFT